MISHMIVPTSRADLDLVAAAVIAAIDQHSAHAGCAHFAEADRLRVRRHDRRRHPSQKAATVVSWNRS
jgi:hypothetical protein